MLTSLEARNARVSTPPLPIESGNGPIQVRDIRGLTPVAANINSTRYGSIDGEVLTGKSIGKRNIVMTFGFNPNWATQSMESLRQILYSYFMPKETVGLRFISTHMPPVEIFGEVESMESDLFSKDPEIQVSVVCVKPYFRDIDANVVLGTSVALPDGAPTIVSVPSFAVPTGILLTVAKGAAANHDGEVRVINDALTKSIFKVSAQIDATHSFQMNSNQSTKYAREIDPASSGFSNILGQVDGGSIWIQLSPGDNEFRVASSHPGQAWELRYYNNYGGL